jgi:hypothetical protein
MNSPTRLKLTPFGIFFIAGMAVFFIFSAHFFFTTVLSTARHFATTDWPHLVAPCLFYGGAWLAVALMVLDSAAHIYGFRRPFFTQRATGSRLRLSDSSIRTPLGAVLTVGLSYLMTIYGFATLYLALSSVNVAAFKPGVALEPIDALYFSTMTVATVGFGDIVPVTPAAKIAVTLEALVGLAYTVLLFSVVAGLAWRARDKK